MILNILSGPPEDTGLDRKTAESFCNLGAPRIVCGGTTARIISNYLQTEPVVKWESREADIPPYGVLPGIEMVCEGVFTLNALTSRLCSEKMNPTINSQFTVDRIKDFIFQCREIHFYYGSGKKKFSDEPDRSIVLAGLFEVLDKLGKTVRIHNL